MTDVVIYLEYWDSCCYEYTTYAKRELSQDILIKNKKQVGVIWVVDESELDKVTGDDWNDAPSCANSGKPYLDSAKTLRAIPIIMGMPIEYLSHKIIPEKQRKKFLHM